MITKAIHTLFKQYINIIKVKFPPQDRTPQEITTIKNMAYTCLSFFPHYIYTYQILLLLQFYFYL